MVKISVEYVQALLEKQATINALPLKDIEWTLDGKTLEISDKKKENWRFIDLGNTGFVESRFWEDENCLPKLNM